MHLVHNFPPYFPKIHSNIILLGLPSDLFPSGIQTKIMYTFLISAMRATFLTHLILRDLITLIMFGEEYKL